MKRGDIYLLDLNTNSGHIQSGMRPVIVIQNDIANQKSLTTIVCGITSSPKQHNIPTHCFISSNGGLPRPSTVLCEQMFTVNKADLKHYLGTVSNPFIIKQLDRCIQEAVGLNQRDDYQNFNQNYRPYRRYH